MGAIVAESEIRPRFIFFLALVPDKKLCDEEMVNVESINFLLLLLSQQMLEAEAQMVSSSSSSSMGEKKVNSLLLWEPHRKHTHMLLILGTFFPFFSQQRKKIVINKKFQTCFFRQCFSVNAYTHTHPHLLFVANFKV